jgi:hypothetical protein
MKKTVFTVTAIGILGVLACSNKKDPEPAPKSRTELLTAHSWKLDYSIDEKGDTIRASSVCRKDDEVFFGKDNSYKLQVNTKCDSADVDILGSWKFLNNEADIQIIRIIKNIESKDTITISELTEDVLFAEKKTFKQRMIK